MSLKKLTAEGRFECGLDGIVAGKVWCFVAVTGEHTAARLGVAIANEPGYLPVPETWANAASYDEMAAHADELNAAEGLTQRQAAQIEASTLAAQNARKAEQARAERIRARIAAALVTLYLDTDTDAANVADEAGCTIDEVHDYMREALAARP